MSEHSAHKVYAPQWALLPVHSRLVEQTRHSMKKEARYFVHVRRAMLRHLSFGSRTCFADALFQWYLDRRVTPWATNWYGHVQYHTMSPRNDPVMRYFVVLLADGECYEGVRYFNSPNTMLIYYNSNFEASLVERNGDSSECNAFTLRFGHSKVGSRTWSILGADSNEAGVMVLQRPVTRESKVLVRLHGERDVWLNVSRSSGPDWSLCNPSRILRALRARRRPRVLHSDSVLPSGYRIPLTTFAARLHFVISIAIRCFYRHLNFPYGRAGRSAFLEADW